MKNLTILILLTLLMSCESKNPNAFNLDVKINGNYSGYLYLKYGKIKDSAIVKNGNAFFKGNISEPTLANFGTNNISTNDKNFYLENSEITTEITFSKKRIKNHTIDCITIDEISGTKTSIIRKDFEAFKLKFNSDKNWNIKLYNKLEDILKQNPNHKYSGDFLSEISNDTILSKKQIESLYNLLNIESQDQDAIKRIESKAFLEYIVKIGDSIFDFNLPNKENNLISTKTYRGQLLFIDFWASWCKPCRSQFPELAKINNDFKEKGLTILGVSIDEKKDNWLEAIQIEKLNWKNVIDVEGLNGKLSKKYGIFEIPYNILVDKKGKIIANDINLKQLRKTLDSILVKKKYNKQI